MQTTVYGESFRIKLKVSMTGQRKQSGFHGITQKKRAKASQRARASQKKKDREERRAKNARSALKKQRDKNAQQIALNILNERQRKVEKKRTR